MPGLHKASAMTDAFEPVPIVYDGGEAAVEPIRPLIRPALALIDSLAYLHQTARGEVVGGVEVPIHQTAVVLAKFE
jgi:hypothetical protein